MLSWGTRLAETAKAVVACFLASLAVCALLLFVLGLNTGVLLS
jgi:hypothetical protein